MSKSLIIKAEVNLSVGFDVVKMKHTKYTGWPKKVSHYQMIQKSYEIVLKPVNKIRFFRKIKVSIKRYNIIPWY